MRRLSLCAFALALTAVEAQVSCTTHDDCIGINFVDSTGQAVGSGKGYCRSEGKGCYYCDAGAVFSSGQTETRNCMDMDNSVDGLFREW